MQHDDDNSPDHGTYPINTKTRRNPFMVPGKFLILCPNL